MKVKSFRKIIAVSLAMLTLLSTTPVFAASTGSVATDPSVGEYTWTRWHGDWRFTELTIPDGIEWINYHAFYNCPYITTLTIPDSVTKISDGAFANCGWLKNVTMSDELLKQLGDEGRIETVFENSPCVNTLIEEYNSLK